MSETIDAGTLLQHRAFVRAIAAKILSDPNQIDDVEQQTWLAALESPPRERGALAGWLGTVARRFALA